MKTLRPLKKVDALPEDQRLQVAHWLKTETLQKTIELTAANFNVDIDQTTLNRFRWRCHATDYLDDCPEAKEAAIQRTRPPPRLPRGQKSGHSGPPRRRHSPPSVHPRDRERSRTNRLQTLLHLRP